MADTSIKISLELADKAAQKALSDFIGKGADVEKSLDKIKKSGTGTFNEISVGIGKSIGIYEIFAGNLAANLAVKAFDTLKAAAGALFDTFIVDGVKGAQDAQDALQSFNFALAQSGIYSKEVSEDFQGFASELQRTTTFSDDLILKNAALIQSLAQLDQDGLKRATSAALDLSAGLAGKGFSVEAASEALAKAANGNVTALQKMGIEIRKGQTDAETFANALKAVEERFGGSAAAKVNTYSGAVAQATNSFEDWTENIGNLIVLNPAIISALNEISAIFGEFADGAKDSDNSLKQLIAGGLSSFLTITAYAIATVDVFVKVIRTLAGGLQLLAAPFLAAGVAARALTGDFKGAKDSVVAYAKSTKNNITALGDQETALGDLATNLLRVKEASERGMEAMALGATVAVEPVNKVGGAVKGLSAEAERAEAQLKSFALNLVNQSVASKTAAEEQLATAKAKAEAEQLILQEQLDNQNISYYDYYTRRAQIDAEFEAIRQAAEAEKLAGDTARLIQARERNLISEQEFVTAKQQLSKNAEQAEIKADTERMKRDAANKKALLAQEKAYGQSKIQATADVFGAIASVAALGGKKNFEIVKAFNLAEAVTAGILAIQKAMASAPPPFNIPAIVSASVLSAANVARIASTKAPSFQDGGIVPGNSFSGDRVSANVNSGEMILNRSQQAALFKMANEQGGRGGSERVEGLLRQLIGAIQSNPIVVNVGGKTVVDTLRAEINAGRRFT